MAATEHSPTARNVLRVLGVVLALGGLALAIYGGFSIAHATPSDQEFFAGDDSGPGFAEIGPLVAGMFLLVIGLAASTQVSSVSRPATPRTRPRAPFARSGARSAGKAPRRRRVGGLPMPSSAPSAASATTGRRSSATLADMASSELRLEQVGYTHPDARRLIEAVQEEYVARYGSRDEGPADPLMFTPPHGSFFVGYREGEAVATGAWRSSAVEAFGTTRTAEIKRMYVVPLARGAGHARSVLAHLERTARAAGHEAMILETGLAQPEAIALYESSGYTSIARFGHYRDEPLCRCFGRWLRG